MATPILEYKTAGAMCLCTGCPTPMASVLPSQVEVTINKLPVLTMVNLPTIPFGICSFLTAKAVGVPTPCAPTPTAWIGADVTTKISGINPLTQASTIPCAEGGVISFLPTP